MADRVRNSRGGCLLTPPLTRPVVDDSRQNNNQNLTGPVGDSDRPITERPPEPAPIKGLPRSKRKRTQPCQAPLCTITVTILYDNTAFAPRTEADWGFACLVEGTGTTILFDTGTKPEVFFHNVEALGVDLADVDLVVISHEHGDHTGSLARVLEQHHGLPVYHPVSFSDDFVASVTHAGSTSVPVTDPVEITPGVLLTGEMGGDIKEQSLILRTGDGPVVITGCSHPGIVEILEKSQRILDQEIYMVFGGFHLLRHSDDQTTAIIERFRQLGVENCGATHCTGDRQIAMFQDAYGDNFVLMGTGRTLSFASP